MGKGTDDIDYTLEDAIPSLSIYPNSTSLLFRHRASSVSLNGCDLKYEKFNIPELNKYFHLAITVNDDTIYVYYNGVLVLRNNFKFELINGFKDKFIWPDIINDKYLFINYYNYKFNIQSPPETGNLLIQKLIWHNYILTEDKIQELIASSNIKLENRVYTSSYSMYVPFTFTSCNTYGPIGPTYETATKYYRSVYNINYTPWILQTDKFKVIDGIQYWKVPRTGIYNIIAAGACGAGFTGGIIGRGIIVSTSLILYENKIIEITEPDIVTEPITEVTEVVVEEVTEVVN
jgi:hypothetical protein